MNRRIVRLVSPLLAAWLMVTALLSSASVVHAHVGGGMHHRHWRVDGEAADRLNPERLDRLACAIAEGNVIQWHAHISLFLTEIHFPIERPRSSAPQQMCVAQTDLLSSPFCVTTRRDTLTPSDIAYLPSFCLSLREQPELCLARRDRRADLLPLPISGRELRAHIGSLLL